MWEDEQWRGYKLGLHLGSALSSVWPGALGSQGPSLPPRGSVSQGQWEGEGGVAPGPQSQGWGVSGKGRPGSGLVAETEAGE